MPQDKTALVLSAGGMFGAYEAGVYAELAEVLSPDVVVGASVGALNGWMIASGCTGRDLSDKWLHLDGSKRIRWRMPGSFPDGFIDAAPLEAEIQEMCSTRLLLRALGVVASDLRTMRPLLFRSPEVTWEHVAASCAVPLFLRPYRIAGRYLCDGGIVDPLPLWAAVEMGATRIVAVNLLKHRPWLVRKGVRALQLYSRYRPCATHGLHVVEICPDARIGTAGESMYWSRENAQRWIDRGRRDANQSRNMVVECFQRHSDSSSRD